MAMLDGIKNKIKPGEPLDKDIYDLEPEELAKVPKTPGSLDEALNNLEKDHEFLLQGDVFTARRDQHLDLVQAREGGGRHPPAAASVRVRPVLRHLSLRFALAPRMNCGGFVAKLELSSAACGLARRSAASGRNRPDHVGMPALPASQSR